MIKKPDQWNADVKYANYNTYTKLAISTQITETNDRIKVVKPEVRRCIFEVSFEL